VLPLEGVGILLGDRLHALRARPPTLGNIALVGILELRLRPEVVGIVGEFFRTAIWPVILREVGRVDPDSPIGAVVVEAAALPTVRPIDLLHIDRTPSDLRQAVARHAVIVDDATAVLRPVDMGRAEERDAQAPDRQGIM